MFNYIGWQFCDRFLEFEMICRIGILGRIEIMLMNSSENTIRIEMKIGYNTIQNLYCICTLYCNTVTDNTKFTSENDSTRQIWMIYNN